MLRDNARGEFMRLYNIYYLCKEAYRQLNVLSPVHNNDGSYTLNKWNMCKNGLEALFNIDFLREEAKNAYNSISVIDRADISPKISSSIFDRFHNNYKKIIDKLTAIIDLYESVRNSNVSPGIDIKIPHCNKLRDYIDILRDIEFIVEQCPYLKSENEELQFSGTDVGSDWITFAIVGVTASFYILNNIASLVNKAIALKSNNTIWKQQEELLETIQIKNDVTQETIDTFKKMKELTIKTYVDELQSEIGAVANPEEEAKVAKSLEKLSTLIDKGVEIYSSIDTPEEIKVLFPFNEKQALLSESAVKYLENKLSSDDSEG